MNKFKLELEIEDDPIALPKGALTLGDLEDFIYSESPMISFSNRVHVSDKSHSIVIRLKYNAKRVIIECQSLYNTSDKGTQWLTELVKMSLMARHDFPGWHSIPMFVKYSGDDNSPLIPVVGFEINGIQKQGEVGVFHLLLDKVGDST